MSLTPLSSHSAEDAEAASDGISLADVAAALLGKRRFAVRAFAALALAGTAWVLSRPTVFASTATFVSAGRRTGASGLSGLAAQFGVQVAAGDGSQTPQFYVDLAESQAFYRSVALDSATWTDSGAVRRGTWLDRFAADTLPPAVRLERVAGRLRGAVDASLNPRTGVIRITASGRTPELAYGIARAVLRGVDRFNRDARQGQAAAERQFLERRVDDLRTEQRRAEERLEEFLSRNRDLTTDPQVAFQRDRLQRDVALRQAVLTGVLQAFEQARIEEVRDTPAITVVEAPVAPIVPVGRGEVRVAALVLLFACVGWGVAALIAVARAGGAVNRATLAQAWDETRRDLRRPYRLLIGG